MANNFEFLEGVDKELFCAIEDAQKLFRDEYFNQCAVQLRIFAEKMAKRVLGEQSVNLTFDDTLNCLKDKIKSETEREFIDDLFFIKKMGNKCAHGEDVLVSEALESVKRAFEAAINYVYSRKKDDSILKLQFDDTLLITGKKQQEIKLVDKYIQLASEQKEELLNTKQGEFNNSVDKNEQGLRNESYVFNPKKYKEKKVNPKREKIKLKIKEARKSLKQNVNFEENKKTRKTTKPPQKQVKKPKKNKKQNKKLIIDILFLTFVTISLIFITKMLIFF
ncbi:MAG: hypothetical protein IKU37_07710 [Candidatus Gastranaerophilales bacterium]|nr:hypothetical protein [Candidatus Gastranaerophilales bacterium]